VLGRLAPDHGALSWSIADRQPAQEVIQPTLSSSSPRTANHRSQDHAWFEYYTTIVMASHVAERGPWDAAVKALDGSVLQSWDWGEWYGHGGFAIERVRVEGPQGTGLAQLLIRPHGPVAKAHLPRGPVLSTDAAAGVLLTTVDKVCERYRPLDLTIEPPASSTSIEKAAGFARTGERWCCPSRTMVVPLLDDESLLRRMRKKTRQQVRRSGRRGIRVEKVVPNAANLITFYALLEETSRRTEFDIQPLSYYESFMRHLADESVLLFARAEGGVAAALVITCFGHEAIAHFGASSTQLRAPGTTAYLYFQAMRLARARGCTRFDLWGLPDEDPPPVEGDQPQGSRSGDWRGIHHFKVGLGGNVVAFPPPLEQRFTLQRAPGEHR
jgi:peptidoglycan pentaglycine glycine transferase (the first glycine)